MSRSRHFIGNEIAGRGARRRAGAVGAAPSPLNGKGAGLLAFWLSGFLAFAACAAEVPSAIGITEPVLDVTLSAPVAGIVITRKFAEGDFVKEGDVILELDKKLEELETARRKLVRDQKQNDFEATRKLFATTKGVSQEELDKKEVEFKVAAAEHEMAAEQLRRRQVIAPIAGTVTDLTLEVGEACQPYQPLGRIVDARRCHFITNVEGKSGARLKAGQAMKLEIAGGAGTVVVQGKIIFLSPVVDPASGLQRVKLLFDNTDGKVQPGVAGKLILE
jgi:RND family efflux transporter MFP subunit